MWMHRIAPSVPSMANQCSIINNVSLLSLDFGDQAEFAVWVESTVLRSSGVHNHMHVYVVHACLTMFMYDRSIDLEDEWTIR